MKNKCIANFDNIHVRFLCGDNSMKFGEITEQHLELAKKNLSQSNLLIGITEKFDESILYFKNFLGWENPYYAKVNVSKISLTKQQSIDEETKLTIMDCNKFDLQLYEFAQLKFQEQINSLGSGFGEEVVKFKNENEQRQAKLKRRNYFRSFYTRFTQR